MRFGGGPSARSGWGVPNQFWAASAATRSIPAWRRRHRTLAPGARLADGYAETGRPVVAADRLALRTDLVLAEWSTIDADRVDQMCAESAAQPARRSVSGASHPAARRWLICTLYAARVRWSATRSLPA